MKLAYEIFITMIILLFPISTIGCFATSVESNETVVLVTGFGPFGQTDINPSQLITEELDGQEISGANIVGIVLPVDWNESVEIILETIEDLDPDIIISTGLAAGRRLISVENIGINLKHDPSDELFVFEKIDPNGPFFQGSSLPTRQITRNLRNSGIPVRQSCYAGTYICNAVMYTVLDYIEENELSIKSGFIHVPLLSSQDSRKGLELEIMVDAIEIAIQSSLSA